MTLGVDRDGLHALLWLERTGNGTVRIVQKDYCERLLVTKFTLNRVLKRMEDDGRIRCLTSGKGATVRTYEIVDPASWSTRVAGVELRAEPLAGPLDSLADAGLGDTEPLAGGGHGEPLEADEDHRFPVAGGELVDEVDG